MNRYMHDGMMDAREQQAAIARSVSIHPKSYRPVKNTSKPKRERVQAKTYPFHPIKV